MAMKIDLNRGVIEKRSLGLPMSIFMYRDLPGVYYNVHGDEVSEEVAAKAGFDVEQLRKQKAVAADRATLEAQMAALTAEDTRVIVEERGPYELVQVGSAGFEITRGGERLLPLTTEAVARDLLDSLVGGKAAKAA